MDTVLNLICHRHDAYAWALPLCFRCSSVYAGILAGLIFEMILHRWRPKRPGEGALILNASSLALMGVVGLGGLYGWLAVPLVIKMLVGLLFGSAIAFFAVSAIQGELGVVGENRTSFPCARAALVLLFVLWSLAVGSGHAWALRLLGLAARVGVASAFLSVNLAMALALFRGVRRVPIRAILSAFCVVSLVALEFCLFSAWRGLHG